jgi:hypothetical protein
MYAFVQILPGFSADAYARVRRELGDEPFDGLVVHLAGPCEGGWRVIQVWRTADDYARYERGRLWAALNRAGVLSGSSAPVLERLDITHVLIGAVRPGPQAIIDPRNDQRG